MSCKTDHYIAHKDEIRDTIIIEEISDFSEQDYFITAYSYKQKETDHYDLTLGQYKGSSIEALRTGRPYKKAIIYYTLHPNNNIIKLSIEDSTQYWSLHPSKNRTELTGKLIATNKVKDSRKQSGIIPDSMYIELDNGEQMSFALYVEIPALLHSIGKEISVTYETLYGNEINNIELLEQ